MAPSVNTQEVSNLLNIFGICLVYVDYKINSILGQHFQNLLQNYVKFTNLQICTVDVLNKLYFKHHESALSNLEHLLGWFVFVITNHNNSCGDLHSNKLISDKYHHSTQ